jgi:hypothetical protein
MKGSQGSPRKGRPLTRPAVGPGHAGAELRHALSLLCLRRFGCCPDGLYVSAPTRVLFTISGISLGAYLASSSLRAFGILGCQGRNRGEAQERISVSKLLQGMQMNQVETTADDIQGSFSEGPR